MIPNVRISTVAIFVGSVIMLYFYSSTIPGKPSSVISNRPFSAANLRDSGESARRAKSPSYPTSTFPPPPISRKFTPLTQKDLDGIEKFVYFVGYQRSGHSIIGSMMDAHPDMIVADAYRLLQKWPQAAAKLMNKTHLFNSLYYHSFHDATKGMRSGKKIPERVHTAHEGHLARTIQSPQSDW